MMMTTVVTDISKQALGILVSKVLDQSRLLYTRRGDKDKDNIDIKKDYIFALNLHIVKSFLDDMKTSSRSSLYITITTELQKILEDIYREMSTLNEIEQSNDQIVWFKSWRSTPTDTMYESLNIKYARLLEAMDLARKWLPISIINSKSD
jgi:hypothetical protein